MKNELIGIWSSSSDQGPGPPGHEIKIVGGRQRAPGVLLGREVSNHHGAMVAAASNPALPAPNLLECCSVSLLVHATNRRIFIAVSSRLL